MKRANLRAIAFVSLVIALVLSINLLVGAQDYSKPKSDDKSHEVGQGQRA